MNELLFLKLGGSLITNKREVASPRTGVIRRLAAEVKRALSEREGLSLVVGHGSGSFGHYAAQQHGFAYEPQADWQGFVHIGAAAARLNHLVMDAFLAEGVKVFAVPPSATAASRAGQLIRMEDAAVREGLRRGLVPVVFGDVCLDEAFGWTIVSTESVLAYLSRSLNPARILLAGEVDGVYTANPSADAGAALIPLISGENFEAVRSGLSGADGFDVTGGMLGKVEALLALSREQPGLEAHVISGLATDAVYAALMGSPGGTLVRA